MPPPPPSSADTMNASKGHSASINAMAKRHFDANIITINVGGQNFQTTKQTLALSGPKSFLSSIAASSSCQQAEVPFIDRDPELFSIILSLLRTGNLPSKSKRFDLQDLILESQFYGIEPLLVNSISDPSQFEPFTLQKSLLLPLSGRDTPSAISSTSYGSLHVAHGSKITSFDWSLTQKSTILTEFAAVDSLLALSPDIAAAGATDFSGLQILDLKKGFVKQSISWENSTRSDSTVQAIGSSPEFLFTSFESGRRNSNVIMVYDLLGGDLRPVAQIAHNEIYGADIDSAVPATKLRWVPDFNLLMASGSHGGPSGITGNIKLWDVRTPGKAVWELKEKIDCFSDVAVSGSGIFKVGINSGEVWYTDLRKLMMMSSGRGGNASNNGEQWVCLGDKRKLMNVKREGNGCKTESHGNHLFVSKGGDLELWSEVLVKRDDGVEDDEDRVFRRNLMGRAKDLGGHKITNLSFGGNNMFLTRKDQQCVEVWQSSARVS